MTGKQIEEFNKLYEQACEKMKGLLILGGYKPKALGILQKPRGRKAITLFEQALAIYPNHWQSLFFVGKLYQRLSDFEKALSYFEAALRVEPTNHNIPQEASLAAMHLNQLDKALQYSKESINRKPGDISLLGNHSMNLLIGGLDSEAMETINKALTINPGDEINQKIKSKIEGVINGKVARPTFKNSV